MSEILPKLIKLLPYLSTTIEMLINAFIDKFAQTSEEVSFFYKSLSEGFK